MLLSKALHALNMLPTIYNITSIGSGHLSVMAKPVGGEWLADEIKGLNQLGVTHVVSLLEESELYELDLGQESTLCLENSILFTSFPIPDRGLPSESLAAALVTKLHHSISDGEHVVIHCRAGIGRTGIIASAILVKEGFSANDALAKVSEARGVAVPDTEEQTQWVHSIAATGM